MKLFFLLSFNVSYKALLNWCLIISYLLAYIHSFTWSQFTKQNVERAIYEVKDNSSHDDGARM